jgi:hypothetical protein
MARSLAEESTALFRQFGDRVGLAAALTVLGGLAHDQGDYARAEPVCQESLALHRELGYKRGQVSPLLILGWVAYHRRDNALAASRFAEGLGFARELGMKREIAAALAALASASGGEDGHSPATVRTARLLGAAEALRETIGALPNAAPRLEFHRTLAATRSQLDEAAFAAAWAEGRAMTLEQAIAYALKEDPARLNSARSTGV